MTFERGKSAMRFVDSSVGSVGFHERIKEFQWGATLPPLGDKKKPRVTTSIGRGYGLMKGAKNLDAGWAFIETYNEPRRFLEDVREAGGGPYGSRVVMELKEYQSSPVPPADKSIWIEGLKTAKFFPESGLGIEPGGGHLGRHRQRRRHLVLQREPGGRAAPLRAADQPPAEGEDGGQVGEVAGSR